MKWLKRTFIPGSRSGKPICGSLRRLLLVAFFVLLGTGTVLVAQRYGRRWRGFEDRRFDRNGVPQWEVDRQFPKDTFTFVRVKYDSTGYGRGGGWATDYRDSDLNFSLRLQQLTTLKVNPEPIYLELTDPQLFEYPFIYMIEPGSLYFHEPEIRTLRKYLLNGGFMMVDDFWGEDEWRNFYLQIKRVFPEDKYEPFEVPFKHEIFHYVYDLKEKPQVPSINAAEAGRRRGITWEPRYDSDTSIPHYWAITDDNDRIMVFICHNTDLGDGWEREGENEWYFREFSVKKAYPMGINIVTYAMTH
jgi:hypothetical protein